MTKALLYKAWIETRLRLLAGLVAASIVCIYYMDSHSWLVSMWTRELRDPHGYHFAWMPLGIREYGWYLWHYLFENYLQQVWALFALLFSFGGLIREKSQGTALFSLGLPVSRRRWLWTRLCAAVLESIALALFAVLVVFIGSAFLHQSYSHTQVLLHALLLVAAGIFIDRAGKSLLRTVSGRVSQSHPDAGYFGSSLPAVAGLHAAHARPGDHNMAGQAGFLASHGGAVAIDLVNRAVDWPRSGVVANRSSQRSNRVAGRPR